MRLLPLKDHKKAIENCVEMLCGFLVEQEVELGKKENQEAVLSKARRELEERLVDSSREVFLFESGHSIVGFAEVFLEEECFPDEDLPETTVKILSFYIVPQARRKKLGSTFFKLIRDWGRDKKAALVEIEVPGYPIAVNQFLEKQGLELVGAGASNCYRAFI